MAEVLDSLLVVDDDEMNRDMLSRRLSLRGYRVTTAEDGARALALIRVEGFDLVLLDVMMPGLSGLEVLEAIREAHPATELPVIMATARNESRDIVEALRLGANDYVTKPLDFPVLLARIGTHVSLKRAVEQIHALERSLSERNRDLEGLNSRLVEANRRMSRDLEAAARVQAALLPAEAPSLPETAIAWAFRPCDELAGDGLGVVPLDATRVALYVLDVSGHGVASALLSVSVARVLAPPGDPASVLAVPVGDGDGAGDGAGDGDSGPTRPASPAEVVAQLNRLFPFDEHTEQYFTIVYGVLDASLGEFRYVTAGHPGPILVSAAGEARLLESRGMPVGLTEDTYTEHRVQLERGDRLYLYSDGVPEAMSPASEQFGVQRLLGAIGRARSTPLPTAVASLREDVERWSGAEHVHDDVSILALERTDAPADAS